MPPTPERTSSVWMASEDFPNFAPLASNAHADVCVIGAGIAGLTTAYLLQRRGKSVVVLSDRAECYGQTGRTSAHLSSAIDDRFYEIERIHGEQAARLAYQSHAAAIDFIELTCTQEQVECEFARVDGYLFLHEDDKPATLEREFEVAQRLGVEGVSKLPRAPLATFDTGPCLRFPRQGIFHPVKYLTGLARCIVRDGGKIHCGQRVVSVEDGLAKIQNDLQVTADAFVVATNTPAPINDWMGIYLKQVPYQSYVIGASIPRGSIQNALYWDTTTAYHYIRVESPSNSPHDILLVGGEDHKVGQFASDAAPFLRLEQWARKRFPMITDVPYRWSGQVQEPVDGLAYMGRAPTKHPNVYVATGDSGMGLTHGTMAGMIISDLVLGNANPWAGIYDPARKPTGGLRNLMAHNLQAVPELVRHLTSGEVDDEAKIAAGSGALVRRGMKKLAVYRDDAGDLHRLSAACTHMGCIVQWNQVERTWDCPCHGSRFDAKGQVLMGPAVSDLSAAE